MLTTNRLIAHTIVEPHFRLRTKVSPIDFTLGCTFYIYVLKFLAWIAGRLAIILAGFVSSVVFPISLILLLLLVASGL